VLGGQLLQVDHLGVVDHEHVDAVLVVSTDATAPARAGAGHQGDREAGGEGLDGQTRWTSHCCLPRWRSTMGAMPGADRYFCDRSSAREKRSVKALMPMDQHLWWFPLI
jgi:hypothetical protein